MLCGPSGPDREAFLPNVPVTIPFVRAIFPSVPLTFPFVRTSFPFVPETFPPVPATFPVVLETFPKGIASCTKGTESFPSGPKSFPDGRTGRPTGTTTFPFASALAGKGLDQITGPRTIASQPFRYSPCGWVMATGWSGAAARGSRRATRTPASTAAAKRI